jgi:hypothetical protein
LPLAEGAGNFVLVLIDDYELLVIVVYVISEARVVAEFILELLQEVKD